MTGPPELGIFCVFLNKIGKISHRIIHSNKAKNQVWWTNISNKHILQNSECKNTICCGTVQLRCHKMVIFILAP